MFMTFDPNKEYCTCYYDHPDWKRACFWHDVYSENAKRNRSAEERLEADTGLYDDVMWSGHPIHALIMYAGVRAWYWTKWRLVDGIKFRGDK